MSDDKAPKPTPEENAARFRRGLPRSLAFVLPLAFLFGLIFYVLDMGTLGAILGLLFAAGMVPSFAIIFGAEDS
ncbi:MAG TPA: hypothetical protein VE172_04435 [Stackebrandtia sp.]|uniref:hypothetical protein n=1 Tax=Stackebrandtia sp. TaxID=2023065 RepID=UPI002D63EE63|nr:hypothetical protein [Stackebrandtia sp.]HZE38040.1 hypothetical protein [Stackebrandtia sp.]